VTYLKPSRTIDSAPPPRTLLEVRERVAAAPFLSKRQRSDLLSALDTLAKQHLPADERKQDKCKQDKRMQKEALRRTLARLPTSHQLLRKALSQRPRGMEQRSWNNIRMRVQKCLVIAGIRVREGHRLLQLSPEWRGLAEIVDRDAPYKLIAIRGFFHFCMFEGLKPYQVVQETFDRYEGYLAEGSLRRHPRNTYLAACRIWNEAQSKHAGWPPFRVQVALQRRTYALPWSAFGDGFLADVKTYLAEVTRPLRQR
jgi:hypothetical protein